MFNVGDVVICIKERHPFHAAKPKLGTKYIVLEYIPAIYPYDKYNTLSLEGEKHNYAAECFIKSGGLTKLERLIYGIDL